MSSEKLAKNWQSRREDFKLIIDKINENNSILDVGSGPISALHVFHRYKTMMDAPWIL